MADHKILIVEDEAPIRKMIAFNLSRAGFEVDEAENSRSARNRIADSRPDLVLIDWMLPDTSGLELTRALRRDDANRGINLGSRYVSVLGRFPDHWQLGAVISQIRTNKQ